MRPELETLAVSAGSRWRALPCFARVSCTLRVLVSACSPAPENRPHRRRDLPRRKTRFQEILSSGYGFILSLVSRYIWGYEQVL